MSRDVIIIGGGLAGLSLSIDLRKRGFTVFVIEKGNYPRHKVCGEYVSMESHRYLVDLCPALKKYHLPKINKFLLSSIGQHQFSTMLDLGGFGISRYLLENLLYEEAKRIGVEIAVDSKALEIKFDIKSELYSVKTSAAHYESRIVCNSSGRKSNFEVKENIKHEYTTNYVGIKYHLKTDRDPTQIEIHNFPGGYCGISNVEADTSCLCYLVNSKKLNSVGNSIQKLEETYLFRNEHLKRIFNHSEFVMSEPMTVSGINFSVKEPVSNAIFFLGDSAGTIAPITGNGMSIGLRSSFSLAAFLDDYFCRRITKQQLIENYREFWIREFYSRVHLSKHFQRLSEYPFLTQASISMFRTFPSLAKRVIRLTHGKPF
jgi:flavin-dependent dehydrogenase